MERETARRLHLALGGVLALLAVNAAANLALDASGRWPRLHVGLELLTALLGMAGATLLWLGWWMSARTEARVRRSLAERRSERDAWRDSASRALEGLGEAIDAQFERWELTPTEREIALMILKGHTHKRIADLTGRKERTVRQHGVTVYRKAGLSGRAELAAYFLDDLMLPDGEREAIRVEDTVPGKGLAIPLVPWAAGSGRRP